MGITLYHLFFGKIPSIRLIEKINKDYLESGDVKFDIKR